MKMRKSKYSFGIVIGASIILLLSGNVEGQWLLQSQNYNHQSIGYDTNAEYFPASIMDRGRGFILRQPGLTGESNTISFESADFPGRYLRQFNYLLYTEYDTHPRTPETFQQDATFIIHPNRYIRGYYAFESVNNRNYFIRHKESVVRITNSSDNAAYFEADASFRFVQSGMMLQPRLQEFCVEAHCKIGGVVADKANMQAQGLYFTMVSPGPGGLPNSVGFELQDYPGFYLRDYAYFAYLDAANTSRSSTTYMQDVNFALRYGRFSPGYYAIESLKYPGRFLRAVGLSIRFDPQDGSPNFGGEASFRMVNGPVYLESKNMPDYKMGLDSNWQAMMTGSGHRYNLFYPGLTGAQGSVSFESYEKPGFYLRHYDYNMDLEDISNPRNPGIFNDDATFYLRRDVWHSDYIVFESVNYRNHSIRHFDYRLMIGSYEDSEIFKEDSCYKMVEGPLTIDAGDGDTSSGSNAGAIAGGIIGGLLLVVLIVVLVIYTNRKFAWVDTLRLKVSRGGGASSGGNEGGLENPSYPAAGYTADEERSQATKGSQSSGASSPPASPTSATDDPFDDQAKPNPVRRLSRRLSNSMSKFRRSLSGESKEEERHIDVPQAFDLNVQDFQPGTDNLVMEAVADSDSKGSFGNPMYGLQQLSATTDTDKDTPWQAEPPPASRMLRQDSLIDTSPVLFDDQQDFSKAMSFFDETLEKAEVTEAEKEREKEVTDLYSTIDKTTKKKKLSPGITPIQEDDLWDIGDA